MNAASSVPLQQVNRGSMQERPYAAMDSPHLLPSAGLLSPSSVLTSSVRLRVVTASLIPSFRPGSGRREGRWCKQERENTISTGRQPFS